ncbi:MAG: hypothetical protein ACR2G3_07710 [Solirubrobacterales bacterium]
MRIDDVVALLEGALDRDEILGELELFLLCYCYLWNWVLPSWLGNGR